MAEHCSLDVDRCRLVCYRTLALGFAKVFANAILTDKGGFGRGADEQSLTRDCRAKLLVSSMEYFSENETWAGGHNAQLQRNAVYARGAIRT